MIQDHEPDPTVKPFSPRLYAIERKESFGTMMQVSRLSLALVGAAGVHSAVALNAGSGIHSASRLVTQPTRSCFRRASRAELGASGSRMSASLEDCMTNALGEALGAESGQRFKVGGGGYGGGGGASVGTIVDNETGDKYFYKMARGSDGSMLAAERAGLQAMWDAKAIRVPRPLCGGEAAGGSFAVFEYLNMGGRASGDKAELMGVQLAQMHGKFSPNGKYGFEIDNTIGAKLNINVTDMKIVSTPEVSKTGAAATCTTPQPNGWKDSWVDFWVDRRLKHMIKLSERNGGTFPNKEKVIAKTRDILSAHEAEPSLVHGDLWGGNQGFVAPENDPVIFDPATYYGDREVDIAMTHVFGGFPPAFYRGYQKEWPLQPGHEQRQTVYNLYHMLNHFVLFGGGYLGSSQRMMGQILQM